MMFIFLKIFYFFILERTNVRRRSQRRNIISLPRPRETDKSSEANTGKKYVIFKYFLSEFRFSLIIYYE